LRSQLKSTGNDGLSFLSCPVVGHVAFHVRRHGSADAHLSCRLGWIVPNPVHAQDQIPALFEETTAADVHNVIRARFCADGRFVWSWCAFYGVGVPNGGGPMHAKVPL
jgi:hypothetical protein